MRIMLTDGTNRIDFDTDAITRTEIVDMPKFHSGRVTQSTEGGDPARGMRVTAEKTILVTLMDGTLNDA